MADYDPRVVALYDADNPDGPDHTLYRALADEINARSVVDLGCGTGILTVTFAREGRTVTGLDPSMRMLAYARTRAGGERVAWLHGTSELVTDASADFAVMSGNVAQHITGDAWPAALTDLHRGLRTGGVLAFESRNPADCAWERWREAAPTTRETAFGPLTEWMEASDPDADGVIALTSHAVFEASGEHLVEVQPLAFRSPDRLLADLAAAGFDAAGAEIWGDWSRHPFVSSGRVMIIRIARS